MDYEKAVRADVIANQLVEKFGSDRWRQFYCKIAYQLSEAQIWKNYEIAHGKNVRDPGKLFHWLCQSDMKKNK